MEDLHEPGPDDVVVSRRNRLPTLRHVGGPRLVRTPQGTWSGTAARPWSTSPPFRYSWPPTRPTSRAAACLARAPTTPTSRFPSWLPFTERWPTCSPPCSARCRRTRAASTRRASPIDTDSRPWPAPRPSCTPRTSQQGLGLDFAPPPEIPEKALARLFPWVQNEGDPWQALLYAVGRMPLGAKERQAPNWWWHCAPLSEWDGTVKVRPA